MRHLKALALFLVLLAAASCADSDPAEDAADDDAEVDETTEEEAPEPEGDPQEGGSVVVGQEREPETLNPLIQGGQTTASVTTTVMALAGSYQVRPDLQYHPYLLEDEAEITEDPFTVTYNIREEAQWSDGEDLTAEDYAFTYELIIDEENEILFRSGYDLITDFEIVDDKTITFEFEEPFAAYRTLFNHVMPEHELAGEDFNTVWDDEITVASGPFEFAEWDRGQTMTLRRNENYWGEPAILDEITIRYVDDVSALIQQFRGGEVDVIAPQPQPETMELLSDVEGIQVEAEGALAWEHLIFNLDREPVDQTFVRQAIAHAIDREAIVDALVRPIRPENEALHSVFFMTIEDAYEPDFERYQETDPEEAIALLEDNGCERNADDIFECDGVPLEIEYTTAAGNERRMLMFEIVQAQLAEVGIQLNANFPEPSVAISDYLFAGDFDIYNIGFTDSPDPFPENQVWTCDGAENFMNYCNEEVDALLAESEVTIDQDERFDLYNQANEILAEDVPDLPMFDTPNLVAWNQSLGGIQANPSEWGFTWNTEEWYVTE